MAYKRRGMLRFLRVRNFALIDQLELHFEDGFNLLSGETGAGKSIIVDALGLLAGSKASADMVRTGESRAIIEAVFEADLKAELGRLGLDAGDLEAEMIIRREISPDERNRVFINNQPTTVSSLRELAPSLLDIHGQHEQQTLLDHARQLDLIDAYADSARLAGKVREIFTTVEAAEAEIAELIGEHARKIERSDLLIFQRDEIQKTDPKPGEAEEVRRKLEVLSNAEKLLGAAARGYEALYEAETSVVSTIAQVERVLREAAQHDSAVERELKSLAMPQARFVIAWQDVSPGRASGIDRPELLISPNSGEEPRPLERIVSGGELSRVMLALRSVLAVDRPQKTLVFDEIDAGIGGKAAETVGQKLKELSMRYQVLCVTHLAQIAAFAAHQYRIDKNVLDGRSVTRVAALHGDERIEELVRMMSGSRVTHAAREHVKELLKATKA